MAESRSNTLGWLVGDYLGHDPTCTIEGPAHICHRRDGRLVRNEVDACHESAARQVAQESRCVICGHGPRPLWNSVLVCHPGGGMAHGGCLEDEQYDRYRDYSS